MWIEPRIPIHRRNRLFINVTSFIDVLFILLLFFILSTTFNRFGSLDVNLPSTHSATSAAEPKVHEVTVTANGTYQLDHTAYTMDQLIQKVKLWSPKERSEPLILKADTNVPYGKVMKLLDQLRSEGVLKIQALTRNE